MPTIPTWWIYPGQPIPQLSSAFEDSEWSDIIIKPAISGGSRGTIRVTLTSRESVRKGQALMEQLLSQGEELMCQPFLPSVQEAGEVSVMFLCGKIMHSIVKWPRSGDFRVQVCTPVPSSVWMLSADMPPSVFVSSLRSRSCVADRRSLEAEKLASHSRPCSSGMRKPF